jgi:hypothetical protein
VIREAVDRYRMLASRYFIRKHREGSKPPRGRKRKAADLSVKKKKNSHYSQPSARLLAESLALSLSIEISIERAQCITGTLNADDDAGAPRANRRQSGGGRQKSESFHSWVRASL